MKLPVPAQNSRLAWALVPLGVLSASVALAEPAPLVKTVSATGPADFKTVQAAIDAAPRRPEGRYIIQLKPGTYNEVVRVPAGKRFITMRGDSAETTIIAYNNSAPKISPDGTPYGTFRSATMFVDADDFVAENLTIANTSGSGRVAGQAIALSVGGDRGVFRNCRITGHQDTLFAANNRQYFEKCYIEGDVDFIFGGSTAWFEKCEIHSVAGGYVTAASTAADKPFGYVFSNCQVTAEPGVKADLGRPWRPAASVTFLNAVLHPGIAAQGWNNWGNPQNEKTARFAEFNSTTLDGPADLLGRVAWSKQLTPGEAASIILTSVLGGKDGWNPLAGDTQPVPRRVPAPANRASLEAQDFEIIGEHARPENDGKNIGFWDNTDTQFETVANLLPGKYQVELVYSVDDGNAGSEIHVAVGSQMLSVNPPSTGGFAVYKPMSAGTIDIKTTGPVPVRITAASKKGNFILNVKSVNIVPAN